MLRYTKRNKDKKYRIVSLKIANDDQNDTEYIDFEYGDQQIQYDDDCVLEVVDVDGVENLVYTGTRKTVRFSVRGNKIEISNTVPLARLWIRSKHNSEMWYKIPYKLPENDNGKYELLLSCDAREVELCADKYFLKVYSLGSTAE